MMESTNSCFTLSRAHSRHTESSRFSGRTRIRVTVYKLRLTLAYVAIAVVTNNALSIWVVIYLKITSMLLIQWELLKKSFVAALLLHFRHFQHPLNCQLFLCLSICLHQMCLNLRTIFRHQFQWDYLSVSRVLTIPYCQYCIVPIRI